MSPGSRGGRGRRRSAGTARRGAAGRRPPKKRKRRAARRAAVGSPLADGARRPRVVVKFTDSTVLPFEDHVESSPDFAQVGPWSDIARKFPGVTLVRAIQSLDSGAVQEFLGRATQHDFVPPNFLNCFHANAPEGTDLAGLAAQFRTWPLVETSYVSRLGPPPTVNPAGNGDWSANKDSALKFLRDAPDGIEAEYAWSVEGKYGIHGADGALQRLIDIEAGWDGVHRAPFHEDLPATPAPIVGFDDPAWTWHGTAVLGVICAKDNGTGGLGIVPNLGAGLTDGSQPVRLVSHFRRNASDSDARGPVDNLIDSIVTAAALMRAGDVLLLEAQCVTVPEELPSPSTVEAGVEVPVEIEPMISAAIRTATSAGIVVVEAGGNGKRVVEMGVQQNRRLDLDTYRDRDGRRVLFPDSSNPDFVDSGAILVTAAFAPPATNPPARSRISWAPHGRRIDCFAWGESVFTTRNSTTNPYRTDFGGTSAASAIVAGAVLALQGLHQANFGTRLTPAQMRALLRDRRYTTPAVYPTAESGRLIGRMPNLRAVIDQAWELTPRIYLRDYLDDLGLPDPPPGPDLLYLSPDIILRSTAVQPPAQAVFGAGSGTEDLASLSTDAIAGQDNFVYVRVRNRGGTAARNVQIDVHFSEPATLVLPSAWTRVGSAVLPNVPTGRVLTAADAIPWPANRIPASGHYCFVALAGTTSEPPQLPSALPTWDDFVALVRDHGTVAWRNFQVVQPLAAAAQDISRVLPFVAPGAPQVVQPMHFEIDSGLPAGAKLSVEGPLELIHGCFGPSPPGAVNLLEGTARVPLHPHGVTTSATWAFPADSRNRLRLRVAVPPNLQTAAYDLSVAQIWHGRALGRVTWRLVP